MNDLVWVKIETTKGTTDGTWSLKGRILKAIFDAIISNQLLSGYFKLDDVYWVSMEYDDFGNEQGEKLYRYGLDKLKAYQGDLFLKIEHLVSIAPIDGELELAMFSKKEEKSLSVVRPIRP